MTPKQAEKYFLKNARYSEGGLWNGNAERPRYGIRTPAPMRKLLTSDDIAVLREKFDAYMREDEYGLTRQDELDPPEGGD